VKALVTGAGGFLGFEIARTLRARGDDVRALQRGAYPKLDALGVESVRGDLADPKAVRDAVAGCDVVFHVAAKAGIWGKDTEYWQSNVVGTQNVLDACVAEGVGRLVHTSTPSVTFDGRDAVNADETLPIPEKHLHHYPRTKAEAERRVKAANATPQKKGGGVLLTTSLRPHLVYGPGDPHILPKLLERARVGRMRIIGDGNNLIDFTYIDNAVHAHLLAADALADDKHLPAGKAYFISQGKPVCQKDWVNGMLAPTNVPLVEKHVPLGVAIAVGAVCEALWTLLPLKGEPLMTRYAAASIGTVHYYDITSARRDLGYEPIVDEETAFQRTRAWLVGEIAAGRL
jgi:2-alkyl-3-oxoalkanoate reductase